MSSTKRLDNAGMLERCRRVGVLTYSEVRCLSDVYGSDIPYAETVRNVSRHGPDAAYAESDGAVRVGRGPYLIPTEYGKSWCFADEDPMNVENGMLGDALWSK